MRATAVWELGMTRVITALAVGVSAQPVAMIAGLNGYTVTGNQTGQAHSA